MPSRLGGRVALIALLLYLVWLPLPFGSVTDAVQPALIVTPLAICAVAAVLAARQQSVLPSPAYRIWTAGAVLFALVVSLQLVPMPDSLLRILSPHSASIWSGAANLAAMLRNAAPATMHTISIDPNATWLHLFRFLAYFATFQAASLLIRSHRNRIALSLVLGATALFETCYGIREAALHRYEIWGWENKLIFNRITGTYVNPNHFAHYAAIVLPLAVFLAATAFYEAAPQGVRLRRRLARIVETKLPLFASGVLLAAACLTAVLVASSRGALLAIIVAFTAAAALLMRPRRHRRRHALFAFAKVALLAIATLALISGLAVFLGTERTVGRFMPLANEQANLVGRRSTIAAAFAIWKRFPIFGSGLGTFENAVAQVQSTDLAWTYNHAHDDYAEIAATTGVLGIAVALVAIVAGYVVLVRAVVRDGQPWQRRAFGIAAATSIGIALVHALVDFNFFIPANPATLAAIAGAAVATKPARGAASNSASPDSRAAAPRDAAPPES